KPVLEATHSSLLSSEEAYRFGLCKLTNKDSRQQVAEAYGLSAASLREDPLQGRAPVAWKIVLHGPINSAFAETITRRMHKVVGQGANVLILHFQDCGGGDLNAAVNLAETIRKLEGNGAPVMTIAFVPQTNDATDIATFLVFACSEIVWVRMPAL